MNQMCAGQVPSIPARGEFRVASVNLHYAGVSRGGDDSRWQASMTALRAWDPDIVLVQEMAGPAGVIAGLHAGLLGAGVARLALLAAATAGVAAGGGLGYRLPLPAPHPRPPACTPHTDSMRSSQ